MPSMPVPMPLKWKSPTAASPICGSLTTAAA
nr:MAG TPA: hypothetical protein [Caudoviricetes sp.]